jgi:D-alanyl-D-alanine carboxypeptidase
MTELRIPADYADARRLSFQVEAVELETIATKPDGREVQVTPATAAAWRQMRAAAARDGITLMAHSGFRSIARQGELIRAKLEAGESLASVLSTLTAPGYSEHHTGRAIDIGEPGSPPVTEAFADTAAYAWLQAHARSYGFTLSYPKDNPHGIRYEPWHWFYSPPV